MVEKERAVRMVDLNVEEFYTTFEINRSSKKKNVVDLEEKGGSCELKEEEPFSGEDD